MLPRGFAARAATAAVATAVLVGVLAGPGWAQSKKPLSSAGLDAASDEGPDPLAPADKPRVAPTAPGLPTKTAEPKPEAAVDPFIEAVRQRLSSTPARGSADDREDHAALVAFYAESDVQPAWTNADGLTSHAQSAIAEMRRADDWGLRAADYTVTGLESLGTPEARADAEVRIGLAVLKYGRHARGGRLEPRNVSRLFDQQPPVYDPKSLIQALAAAEQPDLYLRGLHPKHPQFEKLRQAMLAARGSNAEADPTQVRIPPGPQIKPGDSNAQVPILRRRLGLPAIADSIRSDTYDEALIAAVKRFQEDADLKATGIVTPATRNALNQRLKPTGSQSVSRLLVNMERWRWLPEDLGAFYVWDNVPEQMTHIYDQGKLVLSERMVVGKPSTPTPMFSAGMQFIIFHPSWGVPPGMKANELAPQLRSAGGGFFNFGGGASSVLEAHGLRVTRGGQPIDPNSVNWSNVNIQQFEFVQPPGPKNVLGIVKFRFPNKHNVYMHDTPERHLFGGGLRAFSHGCMRVQNPIRFAEVLLAHDKGMSSDAVAGYVRRGGEIKMSTPIPVHIAYFTTTVDDDGKLHQWPDIYSLDPRTASALSGPSAAASLVTSSTTASSADEPRAPSAKPQQRAKKTKEPPTLLEAIFGNY